jgi:UDP:flavonoid glycosyltransferase YjiC (YdhE family)
MRLVLAPMGTWGDTQALLALGLGLRRRGHEVLFVIPANDRGRIESHGLPAVACGEDVSAMFQGLTGNELVRRIGLQLEVQMDGLLEACRGADALVGLMLQLAGPSVAEVLDLPYLYAVLQPVLLPSRHHSMASPLSDAPPRWVNRAFYALWPLMWNWLFRKPLNRARAKAGLRPAPDVYRYLIGSGHLLLGFDAPLAPVPPDLKAPHSRAGFWFLPPHGSLPPELEAFLDAGPAPVYIGFGSMKSRDPVRLTRRLVRAAQRAGQRLVLGSGWAGLGSGGLPDGCLAAGFVPHELLFPRVAAVVHHGGAGTTAAAARAGTPQVVVPHFGDQFYWGHRVYRLGLGPKPILRPLLTSRRLASRLRWAVEDAACRERCRALAQGLRATDGVQRAVDEIERVVGLHRRPRQT